MKDDRIREQIHQAVDHHAAHLRTDPFLAQRIMNQERTGEPVVKRKLSAGLVLAIVLMLIAVTALAVALLSPKEVVEQVAVPLAQENDRDWRIEMDFSPEELAAFIRACNENGIDLDENHEIMEAIRSGKGYNEEEAIMAVCREAFGGNYGEWTLAERHWFQDMMVSIGWAAENTVALPGPDDLTEEDARARLIAAVQAEFGPDLPLEDREQFTVSLNYSPEPSEVETWTLSCRPTDEGAEVWYEACMNRAGVVAGVRSVPYGRPQTLEEAGYAFTLTEAEAVHLAAEGIRSQTGKDVPLEDQDKYHNFTYKTTNPAGWSVSFISHTADWGRCEARVDDASREVTVVSADVGDITADNILARYRTVHGWYEEWDSGVWAEIAGRAADLPAETMEGRVVKATPWIAWREGLLTRDEAEEKAFRQTGIKLGDVNSAALIDAEPNPVWKFRLLPWDESYPETVVVEIDAVTGEMTDLDLYKSDYPELEPSFHMITLHRIWARLELEENGPLYLARMAVLKRFADMSYDRPEVDSLPIFDQRYWHPVVEGNVVRFLIEWGERPDYEVELDADGIPVRVEELPSDGRGDMPESLNPDSAGAPSCGVDPLALSDAQTRYGLNDALWPLEVQAEIYAGEERTVPREGEISREEAVAFAEKHLPAEAVVPEDAPVGARLYRIDAGLPGEYTRWTIYFFTTPEAEEAWRVTFVDKNPEGGGPGAYGIDVKEPGDTGNG